MADPSAHPRGRAIAGIAVAVAPLLTEALMEFQTALGVEPTGTADAATIAALEKAIAEGQSGPSEDATSASPTPSSSASSTPSEPTPTPSP